MGKSRKKVMGSKSGEDCQVATPLPGISIGEEEWGGDPELGQQAFMLVVRHGLRGFLPWDYAKGAGKVHCVGCSLLWEFMLVVTCPVCSNPGHHRTCPVCRMDLGLEAMVDMYCADL